MPAKRLCARCAMPLLPHHRRPPANGQLGCRCRVLVERQRPPYEQDPPLVTFRSQAGTVRYVWPISQPIGDFGAQRNRVVALRKRLGWRINGGDCSLQECYQE